MKLDNGAEAKKVNLQRCFVEREFQRDLDNNHVNRITGHFKARAVRMPTLHEERVKVGKRWEKRYSVLDGQHTIQALIRRDVKMYVCEVFTGLKYEEKAEIFYSRNDIHKRMHGWVKFKAALAAGQIVERTIRMIVEKAGLKLGLDGESHPDFGTPNILVTIFRKNGEPHFQRLINVLKTCFIQSARDRHLQEQAKGTEFIRGLNRFLGAHPLLLPDKIKSKMKKGQWNAGSIHAEAVDRAGECRRIRSLESRVCEVLCNICDVDVPATIARQTKKAA